jgi:hypothetical protein
VASDTPGNPPGKSAADKRSGRLHSPSSIRENAIERDQKLLGTRIKDGVGRGWHFTERVFLAQRFSEVHTRESHAVRPPRVSACDDGDKLVLDELPQHRVLTTQMRAAAQAAYIESSEWPIATCGRDLLEAA